MAGGIGSLCALDSQLLSALPFCFTAEQFGDALTDELKNKILKLRNARIDSDLGEWGTRTFSVIDPDVFIQGITVLENLSFGRLSRNAGSKGDQLHDLMGALLEENGLRSEVSGLIGDAVLTSGGTNVSPMVHERIGFIRAAMRRPDILVLDQTLQTHDSADRIALRKKVRALLPDATLIHLEARVERQDDFDEVLEVVDGRLITDDVAELGETNGQTDLAKKIRAFGRTSLFDGLSRSQLRLLAFASQWFEADVGEYIFREGEQADAAYLITDGVGELAWGDVALEFDGRFIEPGRLIGDLSVIRGEKRTLDLVVREKMRGLRIGAPEFIEVISSDPTISMSLLRTVSGYLEEVAAYVRELQRNG